MREVPDVDVVEMLARAAQNELAYPGSRGTFRQRVERSARAFLSGRYGRAAARRVDFERVRSLSVGDLFDATGGR